MIYNVEINIMDEIQIKEAACEMNVKFGSIWRTELELCICNLLYNLG